MIREQIAKGITVCITETRGAWYGKSMYGGWYINSFDGKYAYHASTLQAIRAKAKQDGIDLALRRDN